MQKHPRCSTLESITCHFCFEIRNREIPSYFTARHNKLVYTVNTSHGLFNSKRNKQNKNKAN